MIDFENTNRLTSEIYFRGGIFMSTSIKKGPIVKEVGGAILHVENLKESTIWYSQLMNMPVGEIDGDIPFYSIDMDEGIGLLLDDHRNIRDQEKYPICMLKTDDISAAYNFVKENGFPIVSHLQNPHPGLAYFNFEDSEGNVLMMCYSDWVNPNPKKPIANDHPIKNQLNTLVIPVKDLKRATEWYSQLLGKPIKPDRQDGGPIYWFDEGILLDDNRNNQDLDSFPTFMVKATNIHEAFDYVKKNGIEVVREIQYDHYFMIKDLEGNTIMICL